MSTSDHGPREFESDFDRDDDLRALLRSGDPARSLSPADPAALARFLEDIMSADLDVRPVADADAADTGDRATGTRGRNRLTWLVAAAAAAAITGLGGYALSGLGDQGAQAPQAGDRQTTDPSDPGETSLEAGAPLAGVITELTGTGAPGRCAAPSPGFIGAGDQAFEGTVTGIQGSTVTISTTDVFTGEVGETVVVEAPPSDFAGLIQAVDFKEGQTYLVSATDGMVSVCGNSGKATGELRSLYDQAFVR